ncbi:MAG: hypothetical protein U0802_15120 [Candidatus Binatia bacterium]
MSALLGLQPAAVRDSIRDLVAHGAGRLDDERWTLAGVAHFDSLLERLGAYAADRR